MTKNAMINEIQRRDKTVRINWYRNESKRIFVVSIWDPGSGLKGVYNTNPESQRQAAHDLEMILWSLNNQ